MHRGSSMCHDLLDAAACAKFHSLFNDCLIIGQSLLRQVVPGVWWRESGQDWRVGGEVVAAVYVLPGRGKDEAADITLSVLRPAGVLSLFRSRDVTVS